MKKRTFRNILDIVPVLDVTENGYVKMTNAFMDILQISGKETHALNESDLMKDIRLLTTFFRTYQQDIKIVAMNFPVDATKQKSYYNHIHERTTDPFKPFIADQIDKCSELEDISMNRSFYLFVYGDSEQDVKESRENCMRQLRNVTPLKEISVNKKKQILFSLCNPSTIVRDFDTKLPDVKPTKRNKNGCNLSFLRDIQPQGGMYVKSNHIQMGSCYTTCLVVYDFPTTVSYFWLESIMQLANVQVIIDIGTPNQSDMKKDMKAAIEELTTRIHTAKKHTQALDAQNELEVLKRLYDEVTQDSEVMKNMTICLHVSGRTLEEMNRTIVNIETQLDTYKASVMLFEQEEQFKAKFTPLRMQKQMRPPHTLTSYALAFSHPFRFTCLDDDDGIYLGRSFTGGPVFFDLFHKDEIRKSYSAVIVGTLGSGKSTLTKKILVDRAARGDFVRGFDVTGEYSALVEELDGVVIPLDGSSEEMLNPLQISLIEETPYLSFQTHILKLGGFYRFLNPDATSEDTNTFETLMRDMYIDFGLWFPEWQKDTTIDITNLNPSDYPTFSTFLSFIRKQLYVDIHSKELRQELIQNPNKIQRLERIELSISNLVANYGYLFDGHSTVPDITQQPLVMYSLKSLANESMKREVFNAQLFNALTLLWKNLLVIGKQSFQSFNSGEKTRQECTKFLAFLDEAHRIINTDNMDAVKTIANYYRQARKYFGSFILATQNIKDCVPSGNDVAVDVIRSMFENSQYRFIFQQDENAKEAMKKIFGNSLSESELNTIPHLEKAQNILSINGKENIAMTVYASERELHVFGGGA